MVCEKSGTREKCSKCMHAVEHEHSMTNGCDNGFCFPPLLDEEGNTRTQNYKCVEKEAAKVIEVVEVTEIKETNNA